MERVRKNRNSGLTLVEVMVSMLVIMIIVIGAVSYMYACMWNAKRADIRITATRIGQTLLDLWKINGPVVDGIWDVEAFNPIDPDFNLILPDNIGTTIEGIEGIGQELRGTRYEITIDGAHYFITLSYRQDYPNFYLLNACVAWSRNFNSATLESDPHRVWLTSYSIY
ncbi:MAG: prepilin-type N-terminal cleavage/methylation domain-containing protein [Thermoplasmata archaeon]|nr:MAG: prepilin-type N-terminal cleavage/methylation domain-containing protein [Thermoplasmata archaeon]